MPRRKLGIQHGFVQIQRKTWAPEETSENYCCEGKITERCDYECIEEECFGMDTNPERSVVLHVRWPSHGEPDITCSLSKQLIQECKLLLYYIK